MAENAVNTDVNASVSATATATATESEADVKIAGTPGQSQAEDNGPSVDDLMSELAQLKADMARNKNALDKALKEKGEITKKLREKQTAEEAEAEEKAKAEAERAEREAEKDRIIATYEAKAMFAEMGLSGKDLEDAIQAKIDGDEKTVYSIIVKHFETKYETALKTEKSEWLGSRPQVNVGVGSSTTLTKEQFERMGYKERVKLATENPELYKQFTQ